LRRQQAELAAAAGRRRAEIEKALASQCQQFDQQVQALQKQAAEQHAALQQRIEAELAAERARREQEMQAEIQRRVDAELDALRRQLEQSGQTAQAAPKTAGSEVQAPPSRSVTAAVAAVETERPKMVVGNYLVYRPIGESATGTVYRAVHQFARRPVALKLLSPALAQDAAYAEHFIAWGNYLAQLHHAHLAAVYEAGRCGDAVYCAREHVEASSLAALSAAKQKLSPVQALKLVAGVLDALQFLAQNRVPFGPVQPRNILVDPATGEAWLVGFSYLDGSTGPLTSTPLGELPRLAQMAWNSLDLTAAHAQDVHKFLTRLMGRNSRIESVDQLLRETAELTALCAMPAAPSQRGRRETTVQRN